LTVSEALRSSGLDPREARLLLAAAAGLSQTTIVAYPERALAPEVADSYQKLIARRKAGEPVAYILGRQEFYGLELSVGPGALIPRPESELIVDLALQLSFSSVVDLGTGSGAIAIAIKHERPAARVVATDFSAAALAVARRNAEKHGLQIDFRLGSWLEPLAGERFDLIVANPPYVADGDHHLRQLGFEPEEAIIGGVDGLDGIREIAREAPRHLLPGGRLLVEHGMGQEQVVREVLDRAGLEDIGNWPDLARIPRVTGGKVK
jgi:release factor glutamine methyltransferase